MNTAVSLVPEALRPNWMRATWEGAHGSSGIHAQLTDDASATLTLRDDGLVASGRAAGDIVVPDLGATGRISRVLDLGLDGRLSVSHNLLTLPKEAQGSGYARALNDHAFARYADAGVESVRIHAALAVGGYAWARQGFELNVAPGVVGAAADQSRGEQITRLVTKARERGRMTPEQFDSIADRLVRPGVDRPDDALVRIGDLAAIPEIGKAALLGSDWIGSRPIDVTRPWWQSGPTADASAGAALLSPSYDAAAAIDRARAIDATLPASYQMASRARFEDALVGPGSSLDDAITKSTSTTTVAVHDDRLEPRQVKHVLTLGDQRQLTVGVTEGADGVLRGSQLVRGGDVRARQSALDDAWRAIGVTTVNDASYAPSSRKLD